MPKRHCILEYCYRDAANYRVHEWLLLEGAMSPGQERILRATLIDGTWFVADKVGVPDLRPRLYELSGGITSSDHDWHELVRIRPATEKEIAAHTVFGSVDAFLTQFSASRSHAPTL